MTTWNPSDKNGRLDLFSGDLVAKRQSDFSSESHWATVRATDYKSTGKWMFATRPVLAGNASSVQRFYQLAGFANASQSVANEAWCGNGDHGVCTYSYDQNILGQAAVKLPAVQTRGFSWTLHAVDIDSRLYWSSLLPAVDGTDAYGTCWDWAKQDRCSIYVRWGGVTGWRRYSDVQGFATGDWRTCRSSSIRRTGDGKLCFQLKNELGNNNFNLGICPVGSVANNSAQPGAGTGVGVGYHASDGVMYSGDGRVISATAAGRIVTFVIDVDNLLLWVRSSNETAGWWNGNGTEDPVTDTGGIPFSVGSAGSAPLEVVLSMFDAGGHTITFGDYDLGEAPPVGSGGIRWWDDATIPLSWNDGGTDNPATGTGGVDISYITGDLTPACSLLDGPDELLANFGFSGFPLPYASYPAGFDTWVPTVLASTSRRARGGVIAAM